MQEFPVDKSTLADTFKAVICALKLSDNLERSQKFIKDFLIVQLSGKTVFDIWEPEDPVNYLDNLLKEKGVESFEARLCNTSASNTILANYQVGLYSNDKKMLGIGEYQWRGGLLFSMIYFFILMIKIQFDLFSL